MKRFTQYAIFIAIFLVLWKCQVLKEPAAAIMSATLDAPEINSAQSNLPTANYELRVKDMDGKVINLEDYRGKVIFLNFWATWCMPCVAELPSIDNLYKELENEKIAFFLISNEQIEKVKNYHQKKEYAVPFHSIDEDGHVPNIYFTQSIPTTFIINKEGKIIRKSMGAEDWDAPEFIESIKKIL